MAKFGAILRALALLTLAGVTAHAVAAQRSYVFASPDTRASLTDEDARGSLTSFEELNAISIADRIACSMTGEVKITGVLGVYDTSSENSFLIESDLERAETEYLGSLLARYEHQKYVLLFFPKSAGGDRLWIIRTSEPFDAAVATLRRFRVTPVTLRARADGIVIWVVDMGDKFGDKPKQLAAQLGGTSSSQDGAAELIGDEDRAKAAAMFDARIHAFELHSEHKLSSRLWTKDWHDSSTRTCSAEAPALSRR